MASYNKVILIGNLTRDPELRYTPKGLAIAKIGLAVNRSWKDTNSGELREEVTFIDVDAFGKQAETLGQYMKKGSPLMVEGRLRLDTWEDKQTSQKRSKLGVVMESFQFLDSGRNRDAGSAEGGRSRAVSPAQPPDPEPDAGPPDDDDVPF
ncbi:MAG: single-stranded DNA-binding protein [Verrucomicrobia bacterium]|nr:single-stranded DNA-binding protein [Verrucomicrobiota bacterium]